MAAVCRIYHPGRPPETSTLARTPEDHRADHRRGDGLPRRAGRAFQVNEIVEELPRVDIPARPGSMSSSRRTNRTRSEPPVSATRGADLPAVQILIGMLVIRRIYERHGVTAAPTFHGIGFGTAAHRTAAADLW